MEAYNPTYGEDRILQELAPAHVIVVVQLAMELVTPVLLSRAHGDIKDLMPLWRGDTAQAAEREK